jgi:heme exporter protein A
MRLIFSGLSFGVGAGEALTLRGANGAGKTTLLRTMAGFLPSAAGRVALEGGAPDASVGEQCHYVGHLNGVKPSLTVAENLAFIADYLGGTREQAQASAGVLGLADLQDVPAAYLSAGQKRRLGLARLICAERPVWLLDEPATSLDAASQAMLAEMVAAHLAGGGIVVAATHTPLGWSEAASIDLGAHKARPLADAI